MVLRGLFLGIHSLFWFPPSAITYPMLSLKKKSRHQPPFQRISLIPASILTVNSVTRDI